MRKGLRLAARGLACALLLFCTLINDSFAVGAEAQGICYSNTDVTVEGMETVSYSYHNGKYHTNDAGSAEIVLKPEDVMYIGSSAELSWFAQYINAGGPSAVEDRRLVWKLGAGVNGTNLFNISSNTTLPVIGAPGMEFSGTFDGNGERITINSLNVLGDDIQGLFGYIAGAEIRNVDLTINSLTLEKTYIGGIAAYAEDSVITDSTVNLTIDAQYKTDTYVGGIVGYAKGTMVSNCVVEGTANVSDCAGAGGIAGYAAEGTVIENCMAAAGFTSGSGVTTIGGIAGKSEDAEIMGCGNLGEITSTGHAGGIVGSFSGVEKKIVQCYNAGNIIGSAGAGGIAGIMSGGAVEKSFNSGKISSKIIVRQGDLVAGADGNGGIVGGAEGGDVSIRYCYNIGMIYDKENVQDRAGGISGYGGNITGCYSASTRQRAPISPTGATITDCYYDSSLTNYVSEKGQTGLSGGHFISGEALASADAVSVFAQDSQVWTFSKNCYPSLKGIIYERVSEAQEEASAPRGVGYIEVRDRAYSGLPMTISQTEGTDIRYWLFGGYSLSSTTFYKKDGTLTTAADGAGTEGGAPSKVGEYYLVTLFSKNAEQDARLVDKFSILRKPIAAGDFDTTVLTTAETYANADVTKTVICAEGVALTADADYTVAYQNNKGPTAAGKPAVLTITGKGSYTGTLTFRFDIRLGEMTGNPFLPPASGVYLLDESGSWTCDNDSTFYAPGIPVYLVEGVSYTFTKHSEDP